jgi:hypothetical protein
MMRKTSTTIFAVVCAATIATSASLAQGPTTFDKKTIYTFSAPVELPGVALQAGQYIFRLADPDTTRKILQVVSADGKTMYGNFFWVPLERPEAKSEPEIRLMEAAAGTPPAIRAVWYPGERTGWELIYPRQQAIRLARAASAPVLTTTAETVKVEQTSTNDLTRVSSSAQNVGLNEKQHNEKPAATSGRADTAASAQNTPRPAARAEASPVKPAPPAVAQNEPRATTPAPAPATPAREALPKTASPEVMIGIAGIGFLAAAGALRAWRSARERQSE